VSVRVALVAACPFPSPQGSQVFVGQMAERLAAAGHEVHLLTYGQGGERSGRGYRHHRIARVPGDDSQRSGPNLAKPVLDAMLAVRLVSLCREHAIDVVHAHNYEALVAALAARGRSGVPVVYHSHNLMGDELETYFEGRAVRTLARAAGLFLDRTFPRRADRVIALCEWSAAKLRGLGCPDHALSVIPPAVDDDGPLQGTARDREALGLAPDDFVVGYIGNLDAYQNLPLLLEAFARLLAKATGEGTGSLPVPRLLIATHAIPASWALRIAAAGLGEHLRLVEVTGHGEARRALAVSDVVGLPRRLGSGYPVKLLNSMSAAKAVVSAGCGSKVLRDGVDGLVVGDDDPEALAEAIDRCRRNPAVRGTLGEAARHTFLQRLSWDRVLPQIEGVYAGLRESSRASGCRAPGKPRGPIEEE
jgi:glycosyltransferase involved in cell wall biosynthesis